MLYRMGSGTRSFFFLTPIRTSDRAQKWGLSAHRMKKKSTQNRVIFDRHDQSRLCNYRSTLWTSVLEKTGSQANAMIIIVSALFRTWRGCAYIHGPLTWSSRRCISKEWVSSSSSSAAASKSVTLFFLWEREIHHRNSGRRKIFQRICCWALHDALNLPACC